MPAPSIISSSPASGVIDVVLGTQVVVGFSVAMNTATLTSSTFSLTGPGQTGIITPGEMIAARPKVITGREYINGVITFSTGTAGNTILTFTPAVPLRPNVTYTILIVGAGQLSNTGAQGVDGTALDGNYQWSFTTGDLNVFVPPPQSPMPVLTIPLDPSRIRITQKLWAVGNDLSQEINIVFPGPIDPDSVTPESILLSLEPILNDPSVQVPSGLTPTVTIEGDTITILISGWSVS
jgi:hypothetical protein